MKGEIDFGLLVIIVLFIVFFLGLGLGHMFWGDKKIIDTYENCTQKEVRINDCWYDGKYGNCFVNASVCETIEVYRK
jgi:hypothetical protein